MALIRHPCLVLTNSGDAVYAVCRSARELRPDFEYRELVGGTHDIVDEQPAAWTSAVTGFLSGLS